MEGLQASAPFDLSAVVCYYKTLNYPSLELSASRTDSSTRKLFDLKSNRIDVHAKVSGIEEVSAVKVSTKPNTTRSTLTNGTQVSSTVLKKAVLGSPNLPITKKDSSLPPIPPIPPVQTIASSLVIKNGELLTSPNGTSLKLYLVPTPLSSPNQPSTKNGSTAKDVQPPNTSVPITVSNQLNQNVASKAGIPLVNGDKVEDMAVDNEEANELCCKLCGTLSDTKEEFDNHAASHTQSSAKTTTKNTDAGDSPKHQNQVRHQCPLCSASFVRKYRLTIHIRTHTGEKPYKCSVCSKTFKDSDHLRRHARTHSGVKPFKCELCTRTFVDREHLKRHLNVHYSGGRVRAVLE